MSTQDGVNEAEKKQAEADRNAGISRDPEIAPPDQSEIPPSVTPAAPEPEQVRGVGGNAPVESEDAGQRVPEELQSTDSGEDAGEPQE